MNFQGEETLKSDYHHEDLIHTLLQSFETGAVLPSELGPGGGQAGADQG